MHRLLAHRSTFFNICCLCINNWIGNKRENRCMRYMLGIRSIHTSAIWKYVLYRAVCRCVRCFEVFNMAVCVYMRSNVLCGYWIVSYQCIICISLHFPISNKTKCGIKDNPSVDKSFHLKAQQNALWPNIDWIEHILHLNDNKIWKAYVNTQKKNKNERKLE